MYSYKFLWLNLFLVVFMNISVFSQEANHTSEEQAKIVEAKDIPLDSLAKDMEGVEQMEPLKTSNAIHDNSLPVVTIGDKKSYDLKDLDIAAKYDSLWMKELYESAALFDEMYEMVSELDTTTVVENTLNTDTLKLRLERLNQKTPFNVAYNPSLENVIKSFLVRKRGFIERMLTASQFYFPMFEEQLDKYDIPLEMKYLAIVESALNPRARSRVGATGLWQFMYGTGKMYKLDVNSYVDERSDPIKSTEAACKYLSKLYGIFEDWDLALAAYNSGPGNVNKAIRRSGGYKNYWNIRRNLPRETAGYVPAFLATMYLLEYADEHGLKAKKVDRNYFETDTVHVKSLISFDQISELVGIGVEELKVLNPSYKLNIIPYVEGKEYTLRLPRADMGKFVANEEAIYAHVKEQLKSQESPLPQLVKADDRIRYKVRSGDYLGKIAARYGVGVSQIKRWNGLRSNNLRIGQRLTIFTRNPVIASKSASKGAKTVASTSKVPASKIHTVKSGDSLWTISQKYPGISIENLREWNGISGNNLKPGTKLKLCNCSS
ncbi:LysM peptidoglycan-binding domain-containing protein [Maribacter polysiphoniae]|uniref:LysM peptidoglycan-binding domain-containing protein n=1 Tax=Maribacter polysiphoniae TaxID=429344 RepID=A0A316E477_9FLAO|nr:LysM peptidoglycan-binding domain-containing protein [Maribacter polysiphoniae]MBD1260028.1 LysM peptidoglycan-binding domain-containing protein [Maribacter polysiphoniae]PWK25487.1 membrane-bound lytic murein transglycosylase D [Maribacter polysiphoniae]